MENLIGGGGGEKKKEKMKKNEKSQKHLMSSLTQIGYVFGL